MQRLVITVVQDRADLVSDLPATRTRGPALHRRGSSSSLWQANFSNAPTPLVTPNPSFSDWANLVGDSRPTKAPLERYIHHCPVAGSGNDGFRFAKSSARLTPPRREERKSGAARVDGTDAAGGSVLDGNTGVASKSSTDCCGAAGALLLHRHDQE